MFCDVLTESVHCSNLHGVPFLQMRTKDICDGRAKGVRDTRPQRLYPPLNIGYEITRINGAKNQETEKKSMVFFCLHSADNTYRMFAKQSLIVFKREGRNLGAQKTLYECTIQCVPPINPAVVVRLPITHRVQKMCLTFDSDNIQRAPCIFRRQQTNNSMYT